MGKLIYEELNKSISIQIDNKTIDFDNFMSYVHQKKNEGKSVSKLDKYQDIYFLLNDSKKIRNGETLIQEYLEKNAAKNKFDKENQQVQEMKQDLKPSIEKCVQSKAPIKIIKKPVVRSLPALKKPRNTAFKSSPSLPPSSVVKHKFDLILFQEDLALFNFWNTHFGSTVVQANEFEAALTIYCNKNWGHKEVHSVFSKKITIFVSDLCEYRNVTVSNLIKFITKKLKVLNFNKFIEGSLN